LHAHPLTQAQRAQLLGRSAGVPGVVSLSPLADNKPVLKQPPLTQLIEIKAAQLGKIQLKNRTVQVSAAGVSTLSGLTGNASCSKTGLPSAVVASLVQKVRSTWNYN
ncbi:hypothetical protein evm_015375, partial [Chilo suppressalis]